jgi:hypothetical protein
LAIIFLLNQWALPIFSNPVIVAIASTIIFGGGLALFYGLVFNRKTRQGIHDLTAGSYVIKAPPISETTAPTISLIHKRITYSLVGVGLILGLVKVFPQGVNAAYEINPAYGILEPEEWKEIEELYSILSVNEEFFSVDVQRLNRHQIGSSTMLKDLNINVWVKRSCRQNQAYCDELMQRVAQTAFESCDDIDNLSGMQITLYNRFDLGLAGGRFGVGAAWTIDDWRKHLE